MPGTYYRLLTPSGKLDYTLDLDDDPWLATGDTLQSAAWTALDSGVSVAAQSNTTTQATVWVQASSSVTEGEIYDVQCKLTTVGGRIDHRTLRIVIRRR